MATNSKAAYQSTKIDSDVIKNINYYKAKSCDKLRDEQISLMPTIDENQIECTVQSYIMDNKRILINQTEQLCLRLKYITYNPIGVKKRYEYTNVNVPLTDLVDNKIIRPFALFINGLCIPYENISVSICPEAVYLILNLKEPSGFENLVEDIKYAQILQLPNYISYSRDLQDNENILFSFNQEGVYDTRNKEFGFISVGEPSIFINRLSMPNRIIALNINSFMAEGYDVPISFRNIRFTNDNIVLFVNGLLGIGNRTNIKKAIDWDYASQDSSDYAPRVEMVQSDEDLGSNPTIRLDSSLLTINEGSSTKKEQYDLVIFANLNYTQTADNIARSELDFVERVVGEANNGQSESQALLDTLKTPFTLGMDRKCSYSENVISAIRTMLDYNSSLFNWSYLQNANLKIEEYTAEWIMANLKDNGTIWIPREHSSTSDEYIVMLVNGELYKYNFMIKYRASDCIIPIQDINYDDKIEIMRFKNVNNSIFDIVINESDGFTYYSPDIVNEGMVLYSPELLEGDPYTYPETGKQQFPVDYSLTRNSQGYIKITLKEPFYYGKPLKIAYKNRYVHESHVVTADSTSYWIDLGDKFQFCNEYSRYIIFLNGRKLDSDFYRLVLPVRKTTPFYEFKLYVAISLKKDDRLDIMYTPSLMKDIVITPQANITGNIEVDKKVLDYGLGSELYIVWINGKKIPGSCIKDISSTRLRIISNENSIHNLCITKYIPNIDILLDSFNDSSLWDTIIAQLSDDQIYAMLGISAKGLSDIEPNIGEGAVDIKSLMYELIREQYIMSPRVDVTESFIYDYTDVDTSAIEGTDSEMNIILDAVNANKEDNLAVDRDYP